MKRPIRVDEWILLAAVPTLVVVTLVLGFLVYSALYADILAGFDRKLTAACSVSASFIDGDDHARLLEPIPIRALTWDGAAGRLVGADADGRVYAIDAATGEADPLGQALVEPFTGWAIGDGRLFLLTEAGRALVERSWPLTAGERPVVRAQLPAEAALATIAWAGDRLIGAGAELREIRPSGRATTQRVVGVCPRGAPIRGLAWSGEEALLLRSDETSSAITRFSPGGQAAGTLTVVRAEDELPRRAVALATDGTRVFVATRDGLVQWLQPPSGEPGQAEIFAFGFRSRNDPLYVRYVEPMRALVKKRNLTYCYSQIPRGENRIAYVLDASEGEEQSFIGGLDSVPTDDALLTRQVMDTGRVLTGRVRRFERWGLLKVATGPIRDSEGRVAATAGVDVNISTIREQTRTVLMQVLALGSLGLLLATAASFTLARRLTRPVYELKSAALKVAAGQHGLEVRIGRPAELRQLSGAFNKMSRQTRETLEGLARQREQFEHGRLCRMLSSRLRGEPSAVVAGESYEAPRGSDLVNGSGHCHAQGRTFVWLTEEALREPEASRRVATTRDLAARVLAEKRGEEPGSTLDALLALVPATRAALVDHETGELVWCARDGAPAPSADGKGALTFVIEASGASYRLVLRVKA